MRAVRLWIKKEGRAKYISHLDMNRCFTRAVRRAGLALWYTEGFNPHPYLNFLTPLSLGQESDGEPLDIRIEDDMTDAQILRRMNDVLPEGITVVRVHDAVTKPAQIAFARYSIGIELPTAAAAQAFCEKARALLLRGELTAEKTGKQGKRKVVKQVRICDKVQSAAFRTEGQCVLLDAVLQAGGEPLNPALLTDALQKAIGTDGLVRIRRREFLTADMQSFS
ncbi:MAG: DUF2344 domain-containing protein [Clostridia bacterium]|nr:DUF2344 domain-containing protein [Clostridia bacterium]